MDIWGKWEFSRETESRLNDICLKLKSENSPNISENWMALLGFDFTSNNEMEVDVNSKGGDILNVIKEAMASEIILSETLFVGTSINSLTRIFLSVNEFLNEYEFCTFCKNVASWKEDLLVEHSLKSVVLHKLKEFVEATGCLIFSVKELAKSKPIKFCENVLIPLLTDSTFQFSDIELLSAVFSVLPIAQKDLIILTLTRKTEFLENDWLLLSALVKDLPPNSLLNLLTCVQKFSKKFAENRVFGRFLVNFSKTSCFNKDEENILREAINKHKTLLRIQALKCLESG